MQHLLTSTRLFRVATILLGLISITTARAQSSYAITDLGVLPGFVGSQADGINDRGDIVGVNVTPTNQMHGFVLRNGIMTSIGLLPSGTLSAPLSINASGYAVGIGDTKLPTLGGFLFRNNSLTSLNPNPRISILPYFISDTNVIVGDIAEGTDTGWVPTIWVEQVGKPGRFNTTSLSPFPGFTQAFASAANQSLQVVGNSTGGGNFGRGVLWNNDAKHTPVLLTPPPGDLQCWANAVNNLGVAVGQSDFGIFHSSPVVWSADATHTPTALPVLPGDVQGLANGINNSGQVIGYSGLDVTFSGVTPVTWINGQIFLLQTLLDASGTGWQISKVVGINNHGVIVGTGYHNGVQRAFILTPNPI
jgi:uncharacterized membrane protein